MTPSNESSPPPRGTAAEPPAPPESLADLRRQAEQRIASQRKNRRRVEERIEEELDRLSEQLAEEIERRRVESEAEAVAEIATDREEFERRRAEWEAVCEGVEKELAEREQRLAARETELEESSNSLSEQKKELDRWACDLADERLAIEQARSDANADPAGDADRQLTAAREEAAGAVAERERLAARLAETERANAAALEAIESQNEDLAARLRLAEQAAEDAKADAAGAADAASLRSQLEADASAWGVERDGLTAERDGLRQALDETRERLDASQREADQQGDALREKFELALADVERLRARADELEQELAERPAPGAAEAAELASLRAERDDLAELLKTQQAAATHAPADEEVADLRRRFEMAVEDVRQLKNEKAELEQRLDEKGADSASGELDWEAQKRKLLAALEGETEPLEPERVEERATIEGTIRITDEVVAQKDREIADLRAQLGGGESAAPPAPEPDPLSDDERLEAERARLAELEQEWNDKLRAAELELSVERAKIAREQAELAEWRIELETLRDEAAKSPAADGGDSGGGRRWLNKLGLGGGD